jgi:GNAT superfamily N-acetyltransferase
MDMLIKLYGVTSGDADPVRTKRPVAGIDVRKPIGPEYSTVIRWVEGHFGANWASEAQAALANRPVTVWVAVQESAMLGFACYDATARGFVGPIGVVETVRGRGLGSALLLACLRDMRAVGYGYAIAGAVGASEFFRRVAGAIDIPDSTPGLYAGLLAR